MEIKEKLELLMLIEEQSIKQERDLVLEEVDTDLYRIKTYWNGRPIPNSPISDVTLSREEVDQLDRRGVNIFIWKSTEKP